MTKGYILVNFHTKKVVYTMSAPGLEEFDNFHKDGYETVARFKGLELNVSIEPRYNKNRPKGTFA